MPEPREIAGGRRAAAGEPEAPLAVEYGVDGRTIRRWKARYIAHYGVPQDAPSTGVDPGGATRRTPRTPRAAGGQDGGGHGQDRQADNAHPTPDTHRARARGPIARSIRQTATAILAIMEHDTAVIAAARAERPREVVLTDAEHARALSAMARTLRELLATAPELLTTAGESTPEAVAVAEETDPARRAELLRDYALARGQVPAAIAAETAARRAVEGDTLQVVITQEGAEAIAREAGD